MQQPQQKSCNMKLLGIAFMFASVFSIIAAGVTIFVQPKFPPNTLSIIIASCLTGNSIILCITSVICFRKYKMLKTIELILNEQRQNLL